MHYDRDTVTQWNITVGNLKTWHTFHLMCLYTCSGGQKHCMKKHDVKSFGQALCRTMKYVQAHVPGRSLWCDLCISLLFTLWSLWWRIKLLSLFNKSNWQALLPGSYLITHTDFKLFLCLVRERELTWRATFMHIEALTSLQLLMTKFLSKVKH